VQTLVRQGAKCHPTMCDPNCAPRGPSEGSLKLSIFCNCSYIIKRVTVATHQLKHKGTSRKAGEAAFAHSTRGSPLDLRPSHLFPRTEPKASHAKAMQLRHVALRGCSCAQPQSRSVHQRGCVPATSVSPAHYYVSPAEADPRHGHAAPAAGLMACLFNPPSLLSLLSLSGGAPAYSL
jgi:hypothetical protein